MSRIIRSISELHKVTLYHGTNCGNIQEFKLNVGRPDVDYGKGIYFTTRLQQAIDKSVEGGNTGYVYVCELDTIDLDVLEYPIMSEDFAEVIHLCRLKLEFLADELVDNFEKADIVYGLMVDSRHKNIKRLAKHYNDGTIMFDEYYKSLDGILFDGEHMDQICIKSELALSKLKCIEKIQTMKSGNYNGMAVGK